METIEVTAHFDLEGYITPKKIILKGQVHHIEGTGRRWEAKDGLHILAMITGNRVFHLIFERETGIWKILRSNGLPAFPQL